MWQYAAACRYIPLKNKKSSAWNAKKLENIWRLEINALPLHPQTRNSLARNVKDALVAQLVEHLTLNQGVQGSSPCRRTERKLNSIRFPFSFISLSRRG